MDFLYDTVAPHRAFVLAVFLMSLRVAPVLVFTPLLQALAVPALVRVLLVVGLSTALVLGIDPARLAAAGTTARLFTAASTEAALGFTMALAVILAFGSLSLAGRLLDVQVGFGMAQVFDPATRRQVPVLQAAFDRFGALAFFLVDGHHALLRGLAYSLERFPLGAAWRLDAAAPALVRQLAGLFTLGLALAAPVIVCLLLAELALGVLSRNLPQMNMFVVGMPLKIVVGLAALSVWMMGVGEPLHRAYGGIYRAWDGMFAPAVQEVR